MTEDGLPAGPDALTPAWLTAALRASGTLGAATVMAASVEEIGAVQGFAGRIVRVRLRYDTPETGAPTALIAKFPHVDPAIRSALAGVGIYARELRFYAELAAACPVATPRAYYAAQDRASGATVLLLEDLGHLRVGDVVAGCSDADALLAVTALARLHAAWWDGPDLDRIDGLLLFAEHADGAQDDYKRALPTFLERVGPLAAPELVELTTRFASYVADVRRRLGARPRAPFSTATSAWTTCSSGRGTATPRSPSATGTRARAAAG